MDHWKKGSCSECGRSNVWVKEGICFECIITEVRVALQLAIREEGLKAAQIQWEHLKPQMKRDMEESKKYDPQVGELGKKFIETVENDLYPKRKRNRQIWIWLVVVIALIVVIGIIYWWFKKEEKKEI